MSAVTFAKTTKNLHSSVQSKLESWMTSLFWFVLFQVLVLTNCVMIARIPTGSLMDSYLIWWIFSSAGKQLCMIYLFLQTTSWMKATLLAGKLLKTIVTNCFTICAINFCNFVVPVLKVLLGPVRKHWIYEYFLTFILHGAESFLRS